MYMYHNWLPEITTFQLTNDLALCNTSEIFKKLGFENKNVNLSNKLVENHFGE